MVGFIGERARRRRKNLTLFLIFIIISFLIYYLLPLIKLTDVKPADNLLPTEQEIISPEIKITIEELGLKIFDKEQKIIFRNNQIKKLKDDYKILSLENKNLLKSINNFENIINSSSESSLNNEEIIKDKDKLIKKIKKEQLNALQKLKDDIIELKIKNENLLQEVKKNQKDIIASNEETKIFFNKNLILKKINEESNKKINELEDFIEEQNLIIQILQDNNPHG